MPIQPINISQQRATFAALLAALATGIDAVLPGVDPMDIDGEQLARATVHARIQAALDAMAQVKAARSALTTLVAKQKAAIVVARAVRKGVKRVAQSKLGPQSTELQKLGFTPQPARKPTVKTLAKAQVKAEATRTARGTMSSKKRKSITAAPTAPAATAATTASPTAPATAATSTTATKS